VDTSVVGGCEDPEYANDSRRFFDQVRSDRVVAVISQVVIAELAAAPEPVRATLSGLPPSAVEVVDVNTEMLELRDQYIQAGILGQRWADDAAHVAIATVARVDAIVSWNFRHILRLDKMKAYNQVNLLNGYGVLTIITPREVVFDDDID
jgi:hypothetical protein